MVEKIPMRFKVRSASGSKWTWEVFNLNGRRLYGTKDSSAAEGTQEGARNMARAWIEANNGTISDEE